jgi:hypothetical protein
MPDSRLVPIVLLGACAWACSSASPRAPFADEPEPDEPAREPKKDLDAGREPDAGGELEPDDCARTPPSNACGVVAQCGCATSETCDVTDIQGAVACVPAGKAPMGHACTSTVGCTRGLTCVFGTCHAFCATAGEACTEAGTGACAQVQSQGVPIEHLKVCRVRCDLRDPLGCGGATRAGTGVCVLAAEGQTDCVAGGARLEGQTCSPADDCGPGLVCVTAGGGGESTCRRWCRVGQSDCGPVEQCAGFQTPALVDGVEHGVCN